MTERFLKYRTGISRGRETFGYAIVSLESFETGKRYRCNGGGYDMLGTVLGNWLSDRYQSEMLAYLESLGMKPGDWATSRDGAKANGWHYGTHISKKGIAGIDGATGQSNVIELARRMGIIIESVSTPKKKKYHYEFHGFKWSEA